MIEKLKDRNAVLVVLIGALIPQMAHAAYVFYSNSRHVEGWHWWFSVITAIAFALALESAVFVFVVRGNRRASYIFAASSVAINLSYYGVSWSWGVLQVVLISAVLPVAIALYSHEVADDDTPTVQVKRESKETVTVSKGKRKAIKTETKQLTASDDWATMPTPDAIRAAWDAGHRSQDEIAAAIGKSKRTVSRNWEVVKG